MKETLNKLENLLAWETQMMKLKLLKNTSDHVLESTIFHFKIFKEIIAGLPTEKVWKQSFLLLADILKLFVEIL